MALLVPFDETTFYFTVTIGSAATLFGGTTVHSAAQLNAGKIKDEIRERMGKCAYSDHRQNILLLWKGYG